MFPIKKAAYDYIWLNIAGVYKPVKHEKSDKYSAHMSCPKCGEVASLHDHKIEESGQVFPSIICVNDKCNFHEHVKLKDWNPNAN